MLCDSLNQNNPLSDRLSARHYHELHVGSGLSDETIRSAALRTETDPARVGNLLNWDGPARKLVPCLAFPFGGPDGKYLGYCRLKPDNPRTSKKTGRLHKYESPANISNRFYIPPCARAALADPSIPLLITEGEKKSLKTAQEGFPCVGLVGVYGWKKAKKKAADGTKPPDELIDDLAAFVAWPGRRVVLCYDSDLATNRNVLNAEWRLAQLLIQAGARVFAARLPSGPNGEKVGLDDYLIAHGPDALRKLIDAAEPARSPDPAPLDAIDDPHRLACIFLDTVCPDRPPLTLRSWRNEFHRWDGGAYRPVPDGDLRAKLTTAVREEFVRANLVAQKMAAEKPNGDGKKSDSPPTVRPVTSRLVGDVLLALRGLCNLPADIDAPSWIDGAAGPDPLTLVPCRNGIIDLEAAARGGEALLPASPSFWTPTACPFHFDSEAPRPVNWLRFMADLWPNDPECVATLQEWFGYLLTPDTRQQKILFLLGPRRAGKGVIFRVLRELVGPLNCVGPTLGSLAGEFGLQPLLGKSVALVSDARLSGRADAAQIVERLLGISGEDAPSINRKFLPTVTQKLTARFVIASNELFRLGDSSGALAGRFIILRLTRSWYGAEDHHLSDQLLAELPGILLWAIEGRRRLAERGRFALPASAAELLRDFEDLASPVGAFVRERLTLDPSATLEVDWTWGHWKAWCETAGRHPGTAATFGRDLHAAIPTLKKRRPRTGRERITFYEGVRPRHDLDPDPDASGHSAVIAGHSAVIATGHSKTPCFPEVVTVVIANTQLRAQGAEETGGDQQKQQITNCYDHYDHPDQPVFDTDDLDRHYEAEERAAIEEYGGG